jgi:hypothetical protein
MTSSDWTNEWVGIAHLLLNQIIEFFPSKMSRNVDFE